MNLRTTKIFFIISILAGHTGFAQLVTETINIPESWDNDHFMFFTNRTLENNDDGSVDFKKHTTKQTNTLYFCRYDFDKDSIDINYKTVNTNPEKYPTGKIENNPFYTFYEKQRIDRGIKNFYFIVGGYGKNFDKQVNSYMQRLKNTYTDSLFNKAAFIVFAWGDEGHAWRYYNGVRASRRGAADFSIFQHMLDEFISDTTYFETHPNDLTIDILFSSMGNYMFMDYMEERKKQEIPLVKTYNKIIFLGSVAPRRSLEEGKAFYGLDKMTNTVDVYVNHKDALLFMSGIMHLSPRLGRKGPKHMDLIEKHVNVFDVTETITIDDLSGLGHDYLLTNDLFQHETLEDINENIDGKKVK
ncbi:MAG: alpha/beta hydrolase [Flavobacteriales bacterium]|nr:alpha/beta hydrolase [Flavobacteriales bacterium]